MCDGGRVLARVSSRLAVCWEVVHASHHASVRAEDAGEIIVAVAVGCCHQGFVRGGGEIFGV